MFFDILRAIYIDYSPYYFGYSFEALTSDKMSENSIKIHHVVVTENKSS